MSIEVGPVETRFFAGGKELGSIELPPSAFEGQVGLFLFFRRQATGNVAATTEQQPEFGK